MIQTSQSCVHANRVGTIGRVGGTAVADWIHLLIDAMFDVTSHLCQNRTARQCFGIISGSLASFIVIYKTITLAMGEAVAVGWYLIVPFTVILAGISVFCFLSDA